MNLKLLSSPFSKRIAYHKIGEEFFNKLPIAYYIKNFKTLLAFVEKYEYEKVGFIIYNHTLAELRNKLQNQIPKFQIDIV